MSTAPPPLRSQTSQRLAGWALFLLVFLVYARTGQPIPHVLAGDNLPARLIPWSILRFGTVTADPFRVPLAEAGGYRWYLQERQGRLVSFYPIGTAFVALPFYVPLYLWMLARDKSSAADLFAFSAEAENIVAGAITALTAFVVFRLLQRRLSRSQAWIVALVFAFGTLMWPIASHELWQHGSAALAIAVGYALLTTPTSWQRIVGAGFAFGMLAAIRPQTLPFAAAGGIACMMPASPGQRWRHGLLFACGLLPPIVLHVAYNMYFFGLPGGGYQVFASDLFGAEYLFPGVIGLLFSPNRGALVLMPVILFGIVGAVMAVRQWRQDPALAALVLASAAYFAIHAATATWAGGWCFGPRYLTETLPILAVAASAAILKLRAWMTPLAAMMIFWSVLVQFAGAQFYPASNWHGRMGPDYEAAAWKWEHFMPLEDYESWREQQKQKRALP